MEEIDPESHHISKVYARYGLAMYKAQCVERQLAILLDTEYGPGAGASATIYSLIETAKANEMEPYRYLRYLFERLPMAETEADYRALLPQYVDRDFITNMKF